MAARVGTGVTNSINGTGTSIASATKTTTTGNLLVALVKWEIDSAETTLSGLTDTAGNSWNIITQIAPLGEPKAALCYAANITANAANSVTGTFAASAVFKRIIVEEFSGIATSSFLDGSSQTGNGASGTAYTTANITTSAAGLVVLGVGGYTSLSSLVGTSGNPDFTVGANAGDCFIAYLISGSGQTVTPGADSANSERWVAIAQAFKDAGGGGGGLRRKGSLSLRGVGR